MAGTQKAVLVNEIGKPVQLGTRNIPSPQEGQVLVKVTATMLLPHDTYGRDWGLLIDQRLPAVLGSNVAGVITKLGPDVPVSWNLGDRVFGISAADPLSSDQAGLQEYAVLNADAIGKTPDGFSDEQVVTLPINLVTSWTALFTGTGFDMPPPFTQQQRDFDFADASVVIMGGGTNVGQFAVQLASIAGIRGIIVIAGASNKDKLEAMGATHVIDRHGSPADIAQQVHTITGPEGVTQVYNCAQLQVDLAIALLSTGKPSRLRSLLPLEKRESAKLESQRPLCDASYIDDLTNESMAPYEKQFWADVPGWLKEGKILPTEYGIINGLEDVHAINEALDAYREGTRAGPQTVVRI